MPKKERQKYVCFLCGGAFEIGPGFCSVNFHNFGKLETNSKGDGYAAFFQQGAAHLTCLEKQFSGAESERCSVCSDSINTPAAAMKLAIYVYRKPGCDRVVSTHEACFRKIKREEFFLIREAT
jgi:hypothetical protein